MEESKIKVLFFAQYLGQEVYMRENQINPVKLWAIHLSGSDNGYLLLRTVEKLTDDEKMSLAKFIYGHITADYSERQLLEAAYKFTHHFTTDRNFIYNINEVGNALQYFLRIGILLPFTCLNEEKKPITLQP